MLPALPREGWWQAVDMHTEREHRDGMWKVVLHTAGVGPMDTGYSSHLERVVARNRAGAAAGPPVYKGTPQVELSGLANHPDKHVACHMDPNIDVWIHLAGGPGWDRLALKDPELASEDPSPGGAQGGQEAGPAPMDADQLAQLPRPGEREQSVDPPRGKENTATLARRKGKKKEEGKAIVECLAVVVAPWIR